MGANIGDFGQENANSQHSHLVNTSDFQKFARLSVIMTRRSKGPHSPIMRYFVNMDLGDAYATIVLQKDPLLH